MTKSSDSTWLSNIAAALSLLVTPIILAASTSQSVVDDTNTVATIDISKDSVAQLAARVRARKNKSATDQYYSEKAMELLIKQTNFVGQSSNNVIGLIGPPDKIFVNNGHIWSFYKFAAGTVLWKFEVNAEDKVTTYVHEIRD